MRGDLPHTNSSGLPETPEVMIFTLVGVGMRTPNPEIKKITFKMMTLPTQGRAPLTAAFTMSSC